MKPKTEQLPKKNPEIKKLKKLSLENEIKKKSRDRPKGDPEYITEFGV